MTTFAEFPRDGVSFSSADVSVALAGLYPRDADGLVVSGFLGVPKVTAVASAWKVLVGRFWYVRRDGNGGRESGVSAPEEVTVASAAGIPAGQGRIDVVCWNPTSAALSVVAGSVSAAPVAPSVGSLVPVAHVRVNSGDGMVIAGQVSVVAVAAGVSSSRVERRTVPLVLSGSEASSVYFWWRQFATVTFEVPFAVAPHLEVSAVFPSLAVQTMQVLSVTATGFTARGIRFASADVQAGSVTYVATEK